jgi:hypothetical protein
MPMSDDFSRSETPNLPSVIMKSRHSTKGTV